MAKLKMRIEQDTDAESPREWDNAGTMLCAHRRYRLGDEQAAGASEINAKIAEVEKAGGIWLWLYLYDHSGITMSTEPFGCPWDSGQVGIIYIMPDKARKEWGRVWRKQAEACLRSEVKAYDQFLTREVYGIIIEDEDGEHRDSCWGFFGREYAEEEGARMLKAAQEAEDRNTEREAAAALDAACRDIETVGV